MINPAFNYAFVDINEKENVIHGHEVINRLGWQGATTYYRYDGVTYDGDDFICLAPNSNVVPGTNPTLWSYLVQIEGETIVPQAGSDYIARSLGSLAYNTALEAYALAQTGTNLIYIEMGTRAEADQNLQNQIIAETGSRIAADQAIVSFVFGSIAVDLTAETGSRIAADLRESGTRSEADQYLQNLIVVETGSRIAGEQALIQFVFGSIAVDLTNETGSRIAADLREQGTRSTADQNLQNQITNNYYSETGTRSTADQNLQNQITVEIQQRTSADVNILRIASEGTSVAYAAYALAAAGTVPPPLSTLPDVSIPTPFVNQVLAYNGSKWVAMDTPSQVAPGAFTLYLENSASGTDGYYNLRATPSGLPEDLDSVTVGGGTPFVYDEGYITGPINRTRLDGGIWEFNTYSSVSNGAQSAQIIVEVYLAGNNGIETLIFTGTSGPVSSTNVTLNTFVVTQGSFTTTLDDRLLVKYYWYKPSGPSVTASVYHSGSEHASHIHTPVGYSHNDLGGLQGGSSTANQFYHVTFDQNNALRGTSGIPSDTNRYITAADLVYQMGTEGTARSQADLTEQGTRSEAVQSLQSQITYEQGTRSYQDQVLLNMIANLSGSSAGTFAVLAADISAEAGTRSYRDQVLLNLITDNNITEQGTRSYQDQNLQNQITANVQAIANEAVTRGNTDTFQQAEIDSLFALLGVGFSGTFAWWMAQICGGKTDTKLSVVNGIISGQTESIMPWEDFEFYGTGSIGGSSFNRGTAWNGAATLTIVSFPGVVAEQQYSSLSTGPVSSIPNAITVGTGWSDSGTIGGETTIGYYGTDILDSYSTGTITAGQINGGWGFAGTATIYTR